jgi:hypothetical protein
VAALDPGFLYFLGNCKFENHTIKAFTLNWNIELRRPVSQHSLVTSLSPQLFRHQSPVGAKPGPSIPNPCRPKYSEIIQTPILLKIRFDHLQKIFFSEKTKSIHLEVNTLAAPSSAVFISPKVLLFSYWVSSV